MKNRKTEQYADAFEDSGPGDSSRDRDGSRSNEWGIYEKDEFGEDDTMQRNGRRGGYRAVTICIILFDLLLQAVPLSVVYVVFFACGAEAFEGLYALLFLGMDPADGPFWKREPGP